MKIMMGIKKGLLFIFVVGFMLVGKHVGVQAAEKVAVTTKVFKDEKVLEAVKLFDTNGDGYLDKSELASVTSIDISEGVSNIDGLEKLTSLDRVTLTYVGTEIKLGKNIKSVSLRMDASSVTVDAPGAEYITVSTKWTSDYDFETGEIITKDALCHSIDVSKCSRLRDLRLFAKGMTSFKLPKNGGNIKEIRISESSIKNFKVPEAKKLTYLSVFSNEEITAIDPKNAPNLETLYMTDNPKLKSLSLNKNKKLKKIICSGTSVNKLDIAGNSNLEFLSCPYNELTSLDCSKNAKLTAVQCYDNKLTSLNVKKSASVKEVSCANNKIKSLDLSKNSKLKTVICYGNPLKSLYVRDKKNILKKVSIEPIIESVKVGTERDSYGRKNLTVNFEKNNKISKYYVFVKEFYNDRIDRVYEKEQNRSKVNFAMFEGTYIVQALSGIVYKDTVVYAKDTTYKDKVTVER